MGNKKESTNYTRQQIQRRNKYKNTTRVPRDHARAKSSPRAVNSINSVNSNKGTVDFSSVSRPSSASSDALTAHGSNERLVLWPCSVVEHPNL